MYRDSRGLEHYNAMERLHTINEWRAQARRLITIVMIDAAAAEQRGWSEYAERFMDLAMRIEATPLNTLYYHTFRFCDSYHTKFEEEHVAIKKEWYQARRDAGMSLI